LIDLDFVSDYVSDETYDKINDEFPNGHTIYSNDIDGTLKLIRKRLERIDGQVEEVLIKLTSKEIEN